MIDLLKIWKSFSSILYLYHNVLYRKKTLLFLINLITQYCYVWLRIYFHV